MANSINYFKYFPNINYNSKSVVDITRRTKIIEQLYSKPLSFLPYTINDGERPEDIALYYYDDAGKVWLVFLANNIIDPISQWPLSSKDFDQMMISKYGANAMADGYITDTQIISWTGTSDHSKNILYYKNSDGIQITKDTYDFDTSPTKSTDWTAVRIYDYEIELNEKKRNIFLFNKTYANQAEYELKELLSG